LLRMFNSAALLHSLIQNSQVHEWNTQGQQTYSLCYHKQWHHQPALKCIMQGNSAMSWNSKLMPKPSLHLHNRLHFKINSHSKMQRLTIQDSMTTNLHSKVYVCMYHSLFPLQPVAHSSNEKYITFLHPTPF
jgi:hypothetical protein